MAQITLSEAALAKIEADWRLLQPVRFPAGSREAIACLSYYHRSFSTDPSGNMTELGPGISLDFCGLVDIEGESWLELESGGSLRLFISPLKMFAVGKHFIDYRDRKFTLKSLT